MILRVGLKENQSQDIAVFEIEKEMFQEEFANLPEDATLYVEEGRKSF